MKTQKPTKMTSEKNTFGSWDKIDYWANELTNRIEARDLIEVESALAMLEGHFERKWDLTYKK